MNDEKDIVYLKHVLECIADIARYTKQGRDAFFNDDMVRNATLRQMQIMAESTTRLSDGVKAAMPHIDWRKLTAFRNILVHDYLGDLDPELVWLHIERRLPELKEAVEQAIKNK